MAKLNLKDVAAELNKVMSYGIDPKTGEVIDKKEMIDDGMRESALEAEIIKRAKEDLRESDKPDFSADVWDWFVGKGIVPGGDNKAKGGKADKDDKKSGGRDSKKDKDADDTKGRDRGRDRDSKDDRDDKAEKGDREDSRDRGRDRDRDDDKGRDRDRGRDRDERDNDRGRDRDRDDRDNRDRDDRSREREDREPRSRAAKSESYVSAAFRIAQDSVKNKVKQADFVYEMFKGLEPLFEEAGVRDKKYMLERACHYTIEMHGKVNVGSAKELFKDNEDLLEDKKGRK